MSRFVEIPSTRLVETLDMVGRKTQEKGGAFAWSVKGNERVFDLTIPNKPINVRVYTTLALDNLYARDCGQDAVRIVIGANKEDGTFRPVQESTKILRTAPQGASDRVGMFLDRLVTALRKAYVDASKVPFCDKCGSAMAIRESKAGKFYGCTSYPDCRYTLPL